MGFYGVVPKCTAVLMGLLLCFPEGFVVSWSVPTAVKVGDVLVAALAGKLNRPGGRGGVVSMGVAVGGGFIPRLK